MFCSIMSVRNDSIETAADVGCDVGNVPAIETPRLLVINKFVLNSVVREFGCYWLQRSPREMWKQAWDNNLRRQIRGASSTEFSAF